METETKKIDDFGAKIGGARKDKEITRKEKSDDTAPQWMRAFSVTTERPPYIGSIRTPHIAGNGRFLLIWKNPNKRERTRLAAEGFATEADALAFIPAAEALRTLRIYSVQNTFSVYRVFSNGKTQELKGLFATREAAKSYIITNAADLIKRTVEKFGMPHLETVERIGPDYRGGADCSPEMFLQTFGFRGVEFGNWVPGEERREILNFAFDAFRDLADVLGVNPRFISLDGQLSAAFGSRGASDALAHYEPGFFVFNLTRMNGAGSLAHEWFHAFDNYRAGLILGSKFERVPGSAELVTPVKKFATERITRTQSPEPDAFAHLSAVLETRTEVRAVVIDNYINNVDKTRDALRVDLEKIADYLQKEIRDYRGAVRRGGKPATAAQMAEFNAACARILAGDYGTYEFTGASISSGKWFYTGLNDLSKVFKSVRGRSGLTDGGDIIALDYYVRRYDAARRDLEKMRGIAEIEVSVKSNYKTFANKMDAGRAAAYWSSVIEMGARAFAAYVEDRLQAAGRRNDYLVRATDNAYYREMFGVEMFPEGDERAASHRAFSDLFAAVSGAESSLPMPVICAAAEADPAVEEPTAVTASPVIEPEADAPAAGVILLEPEPDVPAEPLRAPRRENVAASYGMPKISPLSAPAIAFEIVDYSEKALAVFGNTKPISEKLKAIGGKFNGRLKHGDTTAPGWIFSKKRRAEVVALIAPAA